MISLRVVSLHAEAMELVAGRDLLSSLTGEPQVYEDGTAEPRMRAEVNQPEDGGEWWLAKRWMMIVVKDFFSWWIMLIMVHDGSWLL